MKIASIGLSRERPGSLMVVDIATGRIEEVAAVMAQRPYKTYCPYALDNVQKLRGDVIGPGISRRIIEKVGRSTGCFHLVEIFQAADFLEFSPSRRNRAADCKVDAVQHPRGEQPAKKLRIQAKRFHS